MPNEMTATSQSDVDRLARTRNRSNRTSESLRFVIKNLKNSCHTGLEQDGRARSLQRLPVLKASAAPVIRAALNKKAFQPGSL